MIDYRLLLWTQGVSPGKCARTIGMPAGKHTGPGRGTDRGGIKTIPPQGRRRRAVYVRRSQMRMQLVAPIPLSLVGGREEHGIRLEPSRGSSQRRPSVFG